MTIDAELWEGAATRLSEEERRHGPVAVLVGLEATPLDVEDRWTVAAEVLPAWFWSRSWQDGEEEADADLDADRVTYYEDSAAFLKGLDRLGDGA